MKRIRPICYSDTYDRLVCGKTAKWFVDDGPRCDDHAKLNSWQVERYGRVPINKGAASK